MTRKTRRRRQLPHGGRRPDPLPAALANMSHIGRAMYVARKLAAERTTRGRGRS